MRVIFVDNLLLESSRGVYQFDLQPHLGLISLIAVAESAGHEGLLYDPKLAVTEGALPLDESLYLNLATEILRLAPDVIGLTTLGCNFICTLKVAAHLKAMNPELPILLGGPHATILDREIMERFPQFDVIVRNEAELTLPLLLDALPRRLFDNILGITFRHKDEVVANPDSPLIANLDVLPRAAYHSYPIKELKLPLLRVDAGRGCPFKCTFCSTASFFGRKYRLKSAERLCAELDYLNAQYGISHFALTHDLFTVSRVKVLQFCEAVEGRGYTWTCSARMDCVDDKLLERMYNAGCRSIYYGVETGSKRMQKVIDKGLDLELFTPTLTITRGLGIDTTISFITGYPQEEQFDQDDTLDLISSCFSSYCNGLTIQLHLLTPEPGTKLIHEFAGALQYDGHISDFNFPTLESDDSEIMERNPDIFMNHHYYRSVLPRRRHVLVTSIYPVLYKLGFPLLRHLLSHYHGKLSCLLSRMFEWAEHTGAQAPFAKDFVDAFMENEWGWDHYLTSLVRYMLTAVSLSASLVREEHTPLLEALCQSTEVPLYNQLYILRSGVAILRDIHNCSEILSIISTISPQVVEISEALRLGRGHYLLLLEQSQDNCIRNFALDEASVGLLEYFTVARSYHEYLRQFQASSGILGSPQSFFDELLRLGILCATSNEYGDRETIGSAVVRRASPLIPRTHGLKNLQSMNYG
jgi:radical SAM superfamily enzyme YgiQ (UPF0313 family)